MIAPSRLPPLYTLHPLPAGAALRTRTRRAVDAGADPGTILCLDREDRLDCAVLLAPDMVLAQARLVVYVAMLGLGDGLGGVLPAGIDVTFRWPDIVDVNLGAVGRIGLDLPDGVGEGDLPPWLALTVSVAIAQPPAGSPTDPRFETTLHDEGGAGITAADLLESFARHFMVWINRWEADGFDHIRAMWLHHAPDCGGEVVLRAARTRHAGIFRGLDDDGALLLESRGAVRRLALKVAVGA